MANEVYHLLMLAYWISSFAKYLRKSFGHFSICLFLLYSVQSFYYMYVLRLVAFKK